MQEAHVLFRGTVQGVGFRYTARQFASRIGVQGWVKNKPDGSVELVLQGEKQKAQELIDLLKEEFASYLRSVELDWHVPTELYSGFSVKF